MIEFFGIALKLICWLVVLYAAHRVLVLTIKIAVSEAFVDILEKSSFERRSFNSKEEMEAFMNGRDKGTT